MAEESPAKKRFTFDELACGRLFDEVPCYISIQNRDLVVLELNARMEADFGEAYDQRCHAVYKRRDSQCPECPVLRSFEDGQEHASEEVLIDRAGRVHNVIVHTKPLRARDGRIVAVVEMFDDITEIRALQSKLASLGQLVGSTAHGIKNVLEGLRGGVYVAKLGFHENNPDDVRTGWEMVDRNVNRVSAMILDMLYCAKDRSPRRLPVSLPAVVREVMQLYGGRARDLNIALDCDVAAELPTVPGEPKDIHALLANLVSNAIDACYGDEDESKSSRILVRVRKDGAQALIEVEDNGAGMDADAQAKLFTMFFSTKGSQGTGLGLLVAHKVATEHGGTIEVKSAPAAGSKFTVRLPLAIPSGL